MPVSEEQATTVVSNVASAVNDTVVETEQSVDLLADALERLWAQFDKALLENMGNAQQACQQVLRAANFTINATFAERAAFDPYFGRVVDQQHSTVVACNETAETASEMCFSQALDSVFRENRRRNPALSWQMYVSQETGAVRVFPGVSRDDALDILPESSSRCDARGSPAYAAPAFGPRRLLFMLDVYSPNLCKAGGGLERAKAAINALLTATSDVDFVAVLMPRLGENTRCFSRGFVRATTANVLSLKRIVDNIGESDCGAAAANTTYAEALRRAFDALDGTVRGTSVGDNATSLGSCQAAVVFVTADAAAAGPALSEAFRERNGAFLNATLHLYTIGRDLSELRDTPVCTAVGGDGGSLSGGGDETVLDKLKGFFRSSAAALKTTAKRIVRWMAPRSDAENGGSTVVTAATPVYERPSAAVVGEPARLLGVVSTDVNVDAMAAKLLVVPNSKFGRSYAFLVDKHGRALVHPSLQASATGAQSAAAPDVSALEVPRAGLGFAAVRQAMATEASGSRVLRGMPLANGESDTRTYFWKPAGGPFTAVYSLAAEDAVQFLSAEPLAVAGLAYYYRLDRYAAAGIELPPSAVTRADGSVLARNSSVVVLAPRALSAPSAALSGDETSAFVTAMHRYLNDAFFPGDQAALDAEPPVRPGVRGDVKRTAALEPVWRQSLARPDAPRRLMFATPRGVMRVMPGESAPFGERSRRVDPLAELWYTEALRAGGALAVTRPRVDVASNEVVVTISHAIFDQFDRSVVLGVSAMDVPQRSFGDLIERVSQCSRLAGRVCFLLDEEARFVTPLDGDARVVGKVMVASLPSLAQRLIDLRLLRRASVPDFASATVCERWVLELLPGNETQAAASSFALGGGCPSGGAWLSEVSREAPPMLSGAATPTVLGGAANAAAASGIAGAALSPPRLYLVMIDAYQFGVGRDCSELPAALNVTDVACRPFIVDQCTNRDFAEALKSEEVSCTNFGGLSRSVADELRRSDGVPKLEEVCSVTDVPSASSDDVSLWLVVALPLVLGLICIGGIVALLVIRSRRTPPPTVNVNVEQREVPADAGEKSAGDDESSDHRPKQVGADDDDDNGDALAAWSPDK
jgi:hypothetical protein